MLSAAVTAGVLVEEHAAIIGRHPVQLRIFNDFTNCVIEEILRILTCPSVTEATRAQNQTRTDPIPL